MNPVTARRLLDAFHGAGGPPAHHVAINFHKNTLEFDGIRADGTRFHIYGRIEKNNAVKTARILGANSTPKGVKAMPVTGNQSEAMKVIAERAKARAAAVMEKFGTASAKLDAAQERAEKFADSMSSEADGIEAMLGQFTNA